jgi:Ricin-type beta-trefoil lectin domain-like
MTRMSGSSGWSNKRGWIIALVTALFVLSAVMFVSPFHIFAASTADTQVTVNANKSLGSLTNTSIGINTAVWDSHLVDNASLSAVSNAGVKVLRYPGGSTSDNYHWQSNTEINKSNTSDINFDTFMKGAQSIGTQPIITINYGSGSAQESAGWVQYANKGGSGYNGPVPTYSGGSRTGHNYGIKYWEIGNEIYGNGWDGNGWETDNHDHSPATYGSNVVAYTKAMKAVDSSIKVGVVLTIPTTGTDAAWNPTVLAKACSSIDFIIIHWYPEAPGSESDASLLNDPSQIATMTSQARSQINQYCGSHASAVQIMITESNSVYGNPGKQMLSIVNALFLADDYMTWLENGVANVDWWDLHNGAYAGNVSSSLAGNAKFGDYGVLSSASCANNACEPAVNTPFSSYFGLQMLSKLGGPGDTMVSSSSNQGMVAVHAVKQSNGKLAVLLVNKDSRNSHSVALALSGYSAANNTTLYSYTSGASSLTTSQSSGLTVQLPAYSLTTVVLSPTSGGGNPTPTPTPGKGNPTPTPTPIGSGSSYYKIVNRNSGQALDISGAATTNGGVAIQWPYSGTSNQQWKEVSTNGGYKLVNRNSGLLLDDPGYTKTAGTQIDQWSDSNGNNQWWNLVSAGNGYYYIVNQYSGLYVDVSGASTANGATVDLWTSTGGNNQQWQLIRV